MPKTSEYMLFKTPSSYLDKIAVALYSQNEIIESITYRDLFSVCNEFKKHFLKLFSNTCCGLFMKTNIYLPSVILSLQKLKCAFVYLPDNFFEKSNSVIQIPWVLSFDRLNFQRHLNLECSVHVNSKINLYIWKSKIAQNAKDILNAENIFSVVQSSGTTGNSKIIQVPLDCIEENAIELMEKFGITEDDKILWTTPLSFDPSLIELLLALYSGASLLIVPYSVYLNQNQLLQVFVNHQVTFFQTVPSVLLRWSNAQIEDILNNSFLRILALGGEEFPKNILQIPRKNDLKIFNLYGITELSCWASIYEITDEEVNSDVPLGNGLSHTEIIIKNFENTTDNNTGELFLRSSSRFCIVDGVSNQNQLISSGDIVKVQNNKIYYIGRKNKIIKRFGNRVSLIKIEKTIFKETGCKNRCIWSQRFHKILTFIVLENCDAVTRPKIVDRIRVKMLHLLPKNSFPDYFEGISKLPLNPHGKVDEFALEQYYIDNLNTNCIESAQIFSSLWFKYLGISSKNFVDNNRSFFELGGNSIFAIQLLSEFKTLTNIEISEGLTQCLFQHTLQDCLTCLQTQESKIKRVLDSQDIENRQKMAKTQKMKIKWKYELKACVDCTPLVFHRGENTYIATGSYSHIFAVIDKGGQEIANVVLPDVIECTPCLSECKKFLYVGCFDGVLYCIDYIKNTIIWRYFTGGRIKSSPLLCNNSTELVFGSYDQLVHCIKSKDGNSVWKTLLKGSIASNIINNKLRLYVGTTKGFCYCLAENTGEILWNSSTVCPIFGSPCVIDEQKTILWPAVEGNIICFSLNDGKIKGKFKADGLIFSSTISHNNNIYFGCFDCNLYKLKCNESGLECISKIELDSAISTSPFISENYNAIIVACNSGFIYVLNLDRFSILYSCKLPGEVFSSPFLYEDSIYVGCRDNFLYCIAK